MGSIPLRGNRTWFGLMINWVTIVLLVLFGGYHPAIWLLVAFDILASLIIVSGEMKWWQTDHAALQSAMRQSEATLRQFSMYKDAVKTANEVKASENFHRIAGLDDGPIGGDK